MSSSVLVPGLPAEVVVVSLPEAEDVGRSASSARVPAGLRTAVDVDSLATEEDGGVVASPTPGTELPAPEGGDGGGEAMSGGQATTPIVKRPMNAGNICTKRLFFPRNVLLDACLGERLIGQCGVE